MLSYLRIKVLSLGAEAEMIHKAENEWKNRLRKIIAYYNSQVAANAPSHKVAKTLESRKYAEDNLNGLHEHRENVVQVEQRAALLAYGFLKGKSYSQIEPNTRSIPRWDKFIANVRNFSEDSRDVMVHDTRTGRQRKVRMFSDVTLVRLAKWVIEAKVYLRDNRRANSAKALGAAMFAGKDPVKPTEAILPEKVKHTVTDVEASA